jgi:signal peptidase I
MENLQSQSLSNWFYLGILLVIVGGGFIIRAKGQNNSKYMENGYFMVVLGLIAIISEWTDFAAVLCILTILTGIIIITHKLWCVVTHVNSKIRPHYVHYSYEFFTIIFVVFILRAFLFEVYEIPSSSMRPDLTVGDFILVNKYSLGIRNPLNNHIIIPLHQIKRGEVIVFKDTLVRNRDLIKRVIAIGGDTIDYHNKKLTINGIPLQYDDMGDYQYIENIPSIGNVTINNQMLSENLYGKIHPIILWNKMPTIFVTEVKDFPNKNNCNFTDNNGFSCKVPAGKYFMMGDNRDNSFDSRYWGFIDDHSIIGRAVLVVFNFHEPKRIFTKI